MGKLINLPGRVKNASVDDSFIVSADTVAVLKDDNTESTLQDVISSIKESINDTTALEGTIDGKITTALGNIPTDVEGLKTNMNSLIVTFDSTVQAKVEEKIGEKIGNDTTFASTVENVCNEKLQGIVDAEIAENITPILSNKADSDDLTALTTLVGTFLEDTEYPDGVSTVVEYIEDVDSRLTKIEEEGAKTTALVYMTGSAMRSIELPEGQTSIVIFCIEEDKTTAPHYNANQLYYYNSSSEYCRPLGGGGTGTTQKVSITAVINFNDDIISGWPISGFVDLNGSSSVSVNAGTEVATITENLEALEQTADGNYNITLKFINDEIPITLEDTDNGKSIQLTNDTTFNFDSSNEATYSLNLTTGVKTDNELYDYSVTNNNITKSVSFVKPVIIFGGFITADGSGDESNYTAYKSTDFSKENLIAYEITNTNETINNTFVIYSDRKFDIIKDKTSGFSAGFDLVLTDDNSEKTKFSFNGIEIDYYKYQIIGVASNKLELTFVYA